MRVTVDTSAWIEFTSGSEVGKKIGSILKESEAVTSAIAIAEISDVFTKRNKESVPIIQIIERIARIVPLTIATSINAAAIKNDQRKIRPKFSLIDALHLSTARKQKAILLTLDKDFIGQEGVWCLAE